MWGFTLRIQMIYSESLTVTGLDFKKGQLQMPDRLLCPHTTRKESICNRNTKIALINCTMKRGDGLNMTNYSH